MKPGPHLRLVLWKAEKAVERIDRESIAGTGLGLSDFAIMEALLHKGPLQISQIGEKVLLTSGSMTAAVNRLEKTGYVKRIQDPEDGRCCFVALTKPGKDLIGTAFARHSENLDQVAGALEPQERADLLRLLKKLGTYAARMRLP
jgi:MarR family 2-MHQ and catechol resistance regulon transcriptional repressor